MKGRKGLLSHSYGTMRCYLAFTNVEKCGKLLVVMPEQYIETSAVSSTTRKKTVQHASGKPDAVCNTCSFSDICCSKYCTFSS